MNSKSVNCMMAYFALIMIFGVFDGTAQTLPSDVLSQLNSYNVSWEKPSNKGSLASMPLGNGDITANVWVENGGDLMMYIGKSDTWSEGTRLLKIGRLRVSILPNPFASGTSFIQTLNLYQGEINITAGNTGSQVKLKVWIDANNAVIRIEASGDKSFTMKCTTEILRPSAYTLPSNEDPLAGSFRGVTNGYIKPSESADVMMAKSDRIEWYHRNTTSMYQIILDNQNLSGFQDKYPDPYLNRTFGAIIKGDKFRKVNDNTLQTASKGKSFMLSVYPYTAQTGTVVDWDNQLTKMVSNIDKTAIATLYKNHSTWWDAFWNRSWVFITGDEDATKVTRGYLLQRFMEACMGRGKYPMKFNGGTLTFDYQGMNGDYRKWGPGIWHQNTRHFYWPLLGTGDFDMLMPFFDCYKNMLPLQTDVTKKYYGHGGAFFPETYNFFGLYILDDWGWGNTGKMTSNPYIRYHYQGSLEVLAHMLEYYDYKKDTSFITNYIVPFATQAIRFFDQHWPRENGKIKFTPANAIEEFWGCTNPVDYIAGLRYTIPQLMAMPSVPQTLKDEWNNCLNALPPIPMERDGSSVLPAEIYGERHNFENPECYTIFPYKIYGIGRPNFEIGLKTFNKRFHKWSSCWSQDPIQAPLVGLTDSAKRCIIENVNSVDTAIRFPAFWAPKSDYTPDFDNGGTLMMGLQNMLIQSVGSKIYVVPAWPSAWNVDYKLWAPDNTWVRLIFDGNTIKKVAVNPSSRTKDVVLPGEK
jgi:alpha-L-fucosidase 2